MGRYLDRNISLESLINNCSSAISGSRVSISLNVCDLFKDKLNVAHCPIQLDGVAGSAVYFPARRLKLVQTIERCCAKLNIANSEQLLAQSDFRIDLHRDQKPQDENTLICLSLQQPLQVRLTAIAKSWIFLDFMQYLFRQCFSVTSGQY